MKHQFLSIKQLFNLAVCAFGIQFAGALMMSNMSSVYRFLGAVGGELPHLWLAAPISGLLIQPLIGQLSDDTLTRYGKRRPYIFVWGVIAFSCFAAITLVNHLWVAALLFWGIGCSINGITEALRALVADVAPNSQKTQAFSWQTILAGIGATLAGILPWFLERVQPNAIHNKLFNFNVIPFSIQLSFILGGSILLVCMLWTIYRTKEKPATHIEILRRQHQQNKKKFLKRIYRFFREIILSIKKTPEVIRKFVIIQIFTWVGMFTMWLYLTLAIAEHIYGLIPEATVVNHPDYAALLESSTIETDIYYGIYQFVSILYAIFIFFIGSKISAKLMHGVSLIVGAMGLIMIGLVHHDIFLLLSAVAVGIMWGSIMTLPYAIVTAGVPRSKIGVYLGIFNITITLPQIFCGLFLGYIHTYIFHGSAMDDIFFAGFSIFIAGGLLILQSLKER